MAGGVFMKLDIKKAFLSPFSDDKWLGKLFVLSLFSVIINLVICLLLINAIGNIPLLLLFSSLFALVSGGYCAQFANNVIHDNSLILPVWHNNFLKFFKYGFFSFMVSLIYVAPFLIIYAKALMLKEVILISLFKLVGTLGMAIILFILKMIYLFVLLVFLSIAVALYWDDFKFWDAFKFNKLFKLIFQARLELSLSIILITLLGFISNLVVSQTPQNIMANIIAIVIVPIQAIITTNLIAQAYKKAKSL